MKRLTGTSATAVVTARPAMDYPVADWQELADRTEWVVRSALADRVSSGRIDECTDESVQCGLVWLLEYVRNPGLLSIHDLAKRVALNGVRTMLRQLSEHQRDRELVPAPDSPSGLPEPEPLPEAIRLAELQAIRWTARRHRADWERLTLAWASAVRPVRRLRADRGQIGWRSSHACRRPDSTWISTTNPGQTVTAGGRHYEIAGPVIDRGHIIPGTGQGNASRPQANALPESGVLVVSLRYLPGVEVFPVTLFAPHDREERTRYVAWLRCFAR